MTSFWQPKIQLLYREISVICCLMSDVNVALQRPGQDGMNVVESPPVPDKTFSRSVSLVSR